jgi:excisionase family DNA binding protein
MEDKETRKLATLGEIAALLNCSEKSVKRRIQDGTFKAYSVGHLVRLDPAEVLAAVKAQPIDYSLTTV